MAWCLACGCRKLGACVAVHMNVTVDVYEYEGMAVICMHYICWCVCV